MNLRLAEFNIVNEDLVKCLIDKEKNQIKQLVKLNINIPKYQNNVGTWIYDLLYIGNTIDGFYYFLDTKEENGLIYIYNDLLTKPNYIDKNICKFNLSIYKRVYNEMNGYVNWHKGFI